VISATLSNDGLTTRRGFEIAFAIGAAMLAVATLAALAAPGHQQQRGRRITSSVPLPVPGKAS
jgi:hypothetical protein